MRSPASSSAISRATSRLHCRGSLRASATIVRISGSAATSSGEGYVRSAPSALNSTVMSLLLQLLDGDGLPLPAAEERCFRFAVRAAVAERETAAATDVERVLRVFAMRRGNDEAVLVVRDGHVPVHFLDHRP